MGYMDYQCFLLNCWSIASVTGKNGVGGIVGMVNNSTIMSCAALNLSVNSESGAGRVAGIANVSTFNSNNAFAGMKVNSQPVSGGSGNDQNGEGISLERLYDPAFRGDSSNWTNGWSESNWVFGEGAFPRLKGAPGQPDEAMKWDISEVDAIIAEEYIYRGQKIDPAVSVYGQVLVKDRDYTGSVLAGGGYSDGTRAGTVRLRLSGTGLFKGSKDLEFDINKRPVTVVADDKTINVGDQLPDFTYTVEGELPDEPALTGIPDVKSPEADPDVPGTYTITVDLSGVTYTDNYMAAAPATVNGILTVVAENDATLSGLSISEGALTPGFSADTTDYTVTVPESVTSITVTMTTTNPDASVEVNGEHVSGDPASVTIPLEVDSRHIL